MIKIKMMKTKYFYLSLIIFSIVISLINIISVYAYVDSYADYKLKSGFWEFERSMDDFNRAVDDLINFRYDDDNSNLILNYNGTYDEERYKVLTEPRLEDDRMLPGGNSKKSIFSTPEDFYPPEGLEGLLSQIP